MESDYPLFFLLYLLLFPRIHMPKPTDEMGFNVVPPEGIATRSKSVDFASRPGSSPPLLRLRFPLFPISKPHFRGVKKMCLQKESNPH